MNFKVYKTMSYGETVFNVYDVDSNRFVVSCHKEENALKVADILNEDIKEDE